MNQAPAVNVSRNVLISTACLSGSIEEKLHAAAAAGFTGIELLEYDLLMSPLSPRRLAADAAGLGLAIGVLQPLHVEAMPPEAFGAQLRRAERKIALAAELGAGVLVCCAARTEAGIDDDDRAAGQLAELADAAAAAGIRLAYEAVPWGRVRTHRHAWSLIERVDHPSLGLCVDSFHLLAAGGAADISGIDVGKISHVQLADASGSTPDVREWSLHHRLFPGQGSLDVTGFLARFEQEGYRGPVALEVFNDVYQQEDPRHTATDAMRSVRALAEAVSAVAPGGDAGGAGLPAAPALAGLSFAEITVDEVSGPLLARALRSLGFAHTGTHLTDPVQLWEGGGACVLLNGEPERSVTAATAAVTALGISTADSEASLRRAEGLLAPRMEASRGTRTNRPAAVATPGGTALMFTDASSWRAQFASTGETASEHPPLDGIDHVSLTESVDDFDQCALFYRSVLGLEVGASSEVTAPFGLVRTWSASDPARRVRVALSTAPLRRGDWAPAVASPQSIAFATADAIGCARTLRERGAALLDIPDNYYDDLDARLAPPAELLEQLREHRVLYHRDSDGAYLHFFTHLFGSRVFFEFVQRVDGYPGFGDVRDVPLRLAAHRRQWMRMLATAVDHDTGEPGHAYSLAHLTALSLSPPDLVDAAAAAGYRYVGLRLTKVTPQEPHYPLANDPALMRATRTHLAATGIEVLDIELARLTSGDDPRDYVRFLEAGAELGARHVIAQLPDSDLARKTDRFAELCRLAAPFGLTVDLEFPSWTETPDLAHATRVLRGAAQPNAGMLIDLLHFARSRSSIDELRALPAEWFHYVHVCDAPAEIPTATAELIHTARFERLFPGEGGIDIHGILAALPAELPYALEIPRAMLVAQVGAKEHARQAISAARRHLDAERVPS